MAAPVIQATGRLRLADHLSSGLLGCSGLCRSGVRTKFGIDMVLLGELGTINNMIKNSIIIKSFHSCQLQIMALSHFQVVNLLIKNNIYIQQ